jgi:uncharacterized membrane protein YesL
LEKKKRFKLFDLTRDGRGIAKHREDLTPGLKRFFISYKNNFGKLVYVNIFYCLGNFPLLFLILAFSGITQRQIFFPLSDLFQNVSGIIAADGGLTPYKLVLFSLEGLQSDSLAPTAMTTLFYCIGALAIFTFGPVNAGCAYILRNLVSGEPVFAWTDFWYAVKRNWKQSLIFGVIDALINAILIFNIFTYVTTSGFVTSMMFWSNVVLFLLYFFMRYYIYVQMVTFKLSIFKILKNSLIFSLIGMKRNVMALLGIIILIFLEFLITFGSGGVLLPVAVVAPIAILFSSFAYMKVYASYYKIKEIMIDPYYRDHPEERPDTHDDEIIMHDDVTERERLEEIKRKNNIS